MSTKSIFELDENIVAALSNASFGIFGVVAVVMEKDNKFVRFHALQSILTFFMLGIISGLLSCVGGVLGGLPLIGWILGAPLGLINFAIGLVTLVAWAFLSYTAYKGRMVKVPFVGDAVLARLEK